MPPPTAIVITETFATGSPISSAWQSRIKWYSPSGGGTHRSDSVGALHQVGPGARPHPGVEATVADLEDRRHDVGRAVIRHRDQRGAVAVLGDPAAHISELHLVAAHLPDTIPGHHHAA